MLPTRLGKRRELFDNFVRTGLGNWDHRSSPTPTGSEIIPDFNVNAPPIRLETRPVSRPLGRTSKRRTQTLHATAEICHAV